jgi:hypothetical protein
MNPVKILKSQIGSPSKRKYSRRMGLGVSDLAGGDWTLTDYKMWRTGSRESDSEPIVRAYKRGYFTDTRVFKERSSFRAVLASLAPLASAEDAMSDVPHILGRARANPASTASVRRREIVEGHDFVGAESSHVLHLETETPQGDGDVWMVAISVGIVIACVTVGGLSGTWSFDNVDAIVKRQVQKITAVLDTSFL